MALNAYLNPGTWSKVKTAFKGSFDLRKFVRDTLLDMNVPVSDDCCPTTTVGQPVRINSTTKIVETFNGTTWVIAAPTIVSVPSTSTSTGIVGQIAFSSGFIYVCVATNTWHRAAIATF